jgi:hypothetical protein
MIQASDVTVKLKLLTKTDSQPGAFADVTVSVPEEGDLVTNGWFVTGDPPEIKPPARKGTTRWFPLLTLPEKWKPLVYTQIGLAYKEALEKAAKEVA